MNGDRDTNDKNQPKPVVNNFTFQCVWATSVRFFYKAYLIKIPTYLISVEVPSLHMFVKP